MNESNIPPGKGKSMRTLLLIAVAVALAVIAFLVLKGREGEPGPDQGAPVAIESPSAVPTPEVSPAASPTPEATKPVDLSTDASGLSKATVVMKTSKGTIRFKLYSNDAPATAKRFAELVQTKFFNGLSFHRVVPGFVVQAGDPKSRNKNDPEIGTGGSGTKLKAEFNDRKHVRGTVAMARAADPDSADSQFYFSLGTFPHLDNKYTVIGQIVDFGEKVGDKDVLDRIRQWDDIQEMYIQ